MISESVAYLDVSFLALSEDKFLTVTKRMGDFQGILKSPSAHGAIREKQQRGVAGEESPVV